MEKKQFKAFCKKEFETRGFKKRKNAFYLLGQDLLCGVDLQKSSYGDFYYINYCFYIGDFSNTTSYPAYYESDVQGRIAVMSKKQTSQGKCFMTAMVEYEEYTEEELKTFFEKEFAEKVLPPVSQGKKYLLNNLNTLYFLTLNQEEVMRKLQS